MLIDCHVHAGELGKHYPDWWMAELYRGWGGLKQYSDAKAPDTEKLTLGQRLVRQMDHAGIDLMCIMTSDHRRVYSDRLGPYTPNDYLVEVKATAPERFALTCSVDPLRDIYESVQEIERCAKVHGMKVCKLYPTYDHFDPRDPQLDPIYEKLVELDMTMQIHMGWTPCCNAPMKFQQPHLLDDVAQKFPTLRIVVAHMGWPWIEECMALVAKWEHVHADIAYWGWFGPRKVFESLKLFGRLCGFDKLVYGSENAFTTFAPDMMRNLNKQAAIVRDDPIPDAEMEKILWKNAARLWKIETTRLEAARKHAA